MSEIKYNPDYYEKDPDKKDREWANRMVTAYRMEWRPIVPDVRKARDNMDILLSQQSLEDLKKYFRQGRKFLDDLGTDMVAIAVFERIRNILVAEFIKGAYKPNIEAIDVSADIERKNDANLLRNRKMIEGLMTTLNQKVGDPPYKVPEDKFHGNVNRFDEMGLESNDDTDVGFYMRTLHRLWHEISAEKVVQSLMQFNKIDDNVEKLVNDILGKMAVSYQCYVSPYTGEIKWRYIDPLDMKAIKGESNDFQDAMCIGNEKRVTVRKFMEFAGPDFNFENKEHRKALCSAVNMSNSHNYSYIAYNGCWEVSERGEHVNVASYGELLSHMVDIGYIEWKSIDGEAKLKHKASGFLYDIGYSDDVSKKVAYTREVTEYWNTYKSWFLSTGTSSQFLFRYGKLYQVLTYGGDDEYCSYSLFAYVGTGKSAVEIGTPFVKIVNLAFYKMFWGIAESKPRERIINYDAIAPLISKIKQAPVAGGMEIEEMPKAGVEGAVNQILDMYENSLRQIVVTPKDANGSPIPGQNRPHWYEEGGLDPLTVAMQTVMDWGEAQISTRLGINAQRDAATPDPKDGYKLSQAALKQSQNATHYVPYMIQRTIQHTATITLNMAQDGIELKNKCYTFLTKLIGEEDIDSFRSLERVPFHNYAMFVNVFNTDDKKVDLEQDAKLAWQRDQITYDQYLMIKEMDNPKEAGAILSFYRERNDRKRAEEAKAAQQSAIQLDQLKTNNQALLIQLKGKEDRETENVRGEWYMRAHQIPADAALQKKQMDNESNNQRQQEHADAQIKVNKAKTDLENQKPLPPAAQQQAMEIADTISANP